MKLVEKTIIAKEKEGVVLEKEVFDAMEKSVTADADMTKVFARKGVTFKCSFCETKKEIEVLEQTRRDETRSNKSPTVNHCTIQ